MGPNATSPNSVWMSPGSMTMTSTPKLLSSNLRQSDHPSSACLVAMYQDPNGACIFPAMEETFTIFPAP